jgi:glyoxalase family protein
MQQLTLTGIHHLTAISSSIRRNHQFYTQVMGLRLVKRSVNQDDVSAYHLFYADGAGSPGTDITFFDWDVPPERRGMHAVVETGMRVNGMASLQYWASRFDELGVKHTPIAERDGRATLVFEDGEGLRLALVDDEGKGDPPVVWMGSTVPVEHQLRGLGPITMSVPQLAPTDAVLTQVMGLRHARQYSHVDNAAHTVHVYVMGDGGAHAELHVAVQPGLPVTRQGAGGVHHVAFRTPTFEQYDGWAERLAELGIPNSGKVDRYWFRSLYFREPNGVLFEIATDGPGFAVDEPQETLGQQVVLPPFLEPRRASILAALEPID